jgi:hypothetical protein
MLAEHSCSPGHLHRILGAASRRKSISVMALGTRALESGGVGELKCDEQPLFGRNSPGFVKLMFRELIPKLTGTPPPRGAH